MTDAILTALEHQLVCYQRLAKLAGIQHEHVQHSRTEELLTVLSQRQEVLDQLSGLEQTLVPAKKRWADYLTELTPDLREKAEDLMARTRELLEQITTSDRNDSIILQQRKITVGRELGHATVARHVNKMYAAAAYGGRRGSMDIQK